MNRTLPLLATIPTLLFSIPLETRAEFDTRDPRGITVTGECLSKVAQDRGAVTIGSSVVAKDARKATEEAVKSHEVIKADIAALKLKDATQQTVQTSVYEECSYPHDGKKICTGFRSTISTRFETSDIPRLGDVIAAAAKYGAQDISQLETFVSPTKDKEAREACLEVATKNALGKAQKLASGAGVSLGKLIALSESSTESRVVPQFARGKTYADVAAASAPSIDTQPEDLRVTVTAVYGIDEGLSSQR
jgi:uncharacterized protein YggE